MNERVQSKAPYKGHGRLLLGLILGVVAFWLFAQTTLNVASDIRRDLDLDASSMNVAVAITSLFCGIFVVVLGGLADRIGRLKVTRIGFYLSIAGSLLVAITPRSELAAPVLLLGRALQGVSAACIMPASLALVKTFWDGAERQRALSLWSLGAWGSAGLCSLVGGVMSQNFGWRSIFWVATAVSGLGLWLLRGAPESRAETDGEYRFDLSGVLAFMFAIVALEVLVTQGNKLGWASPLSLTLLAGAVGFGWLFFRIENKATNPFFDFSLFENATYTGATISNFLINGTAGTLIVSLQLVQLGGGLNAEQAGLLTLGYAIAIIAFIRVGEKLLQRYGPRRPMLWGCLITGLGIIMVSPAHLPLPDYKTLASIGYTLFGVGLAFYATPSIDAALSNLPAAQAGSGAGIYKMASSLGAAFGVAISAAIFTARSGRSASEMWLDGMLTFAGREDNRAVREAAIVALAFNVVMVAMAGVSIMLTVPKGRK